jgi:hypothetical protein
MSEIEFETAENAIKNDDRFLAVCYRTGKNKILCKEVKKLSEAEEILKNTDNPAPEKERSFKGEFCTLAPADYETPSEEEPNESEESEDEYGEEEN